MTSKINIQLVAALPGQVIFGSKRFFLPIED
jgi:hypothetical protein